MSDPAVLVFTTNSSDGTQVCAEIEIIDNEVLEVDHNFTVSISSTSPEISLILPIDAVIRIEDNDGKSNEFFCICVRIASYMMSVCLSDPFSKLA